MILKTCYVCGKKVEKLIESKCQNCLKEKMPLLESYKNPNFKICNSSGKIKYKNYFYTQKEIQEMLPNIIKANINLNDIYKLNDIKIEDFEIDGHKVKFNCELNYEVKT